MDLFLQHQAAFWLALGFVLLAVEILAFGLGSGVLLFGSLGAILTGILLWAGWLPAVWWIGIACFAIASGALAAVLWKPLMAMQNNNARMGEDQSSDLIGYRFVLDTEITRQTPGKLRYSGIDWRVYLSERADSDRLAAGQRVQVERVNAGRFDVIAADSPD